MNCNRCGSPVEANSSFCRTCGNQINQTVVPLNAQPTVVPQNLQPTVVPKNNNGAILAIVFVLIVFIGAGVAGVTILKQTKANTPVVVDQTQNIALNETTKAVKTTKTAVWNYTTTTNRVNTLDENDYYKLNGVDIVIPNGYTPSYSNGMLTIFDTTSSKYYLVNVVDSIVKNVDLDVYRNNLLTEGYAVNNLVKTTVIDCDAIQFDMDTNIGHIDTYLIQTTPIKTTLFMFVNENDMNYKSNIMKISISK